MSWFRILTCLVFSLALSLALHAGTDEELFQDAQANALHYLRTCATGHIEENPTLYMVYLRDPGLARHILNEAANRLEALNYETIVEQTNHLAEETSILERLKSLQEQEENPAQNIIWHALLYMINTAHESIHAAAIGHTLLRTMQPNLQELPPPDGLNLTDIHLEQLPGDEPFARRIPRRLLFTYALLRSM